MKGKTSNGGDTSERSALLITLIYPIITRGYPNLDQCHATII